RRMMPVKIKRAYEKPGARDGTRILVDGLWPRGVKKADLQISAWEKSIAPSKALRTWYGHEPDKWPEFRKRYRKELAESPRKEVLDRLIGLAGQGSMTLVFGARDAERSNAAVIAEVIQAKLKSSR
ncbi:MAG TPA: DUF488 family protein, partial [Terriglobales bacterium]|nr:DUF488 family protein [Terriglobales bacterium]